MISSLWLAGLLNGLGSLWILGLLPFHDSLKSHGLIIHSG